MTGWSEPDPSKTSQTYTDIGSALPGIIYVGWSTGRNQNWTLLAYQLGLIEGKVEPTVEHWQTLTANIQALLAGSACQVWQLSGLAVDVLHRVINSYRKKNKSTPFKTHTMTLEKQLETSRFTRKGDPYPQISASASKMVAGGKKCAPKSTITPTKTCSAKFCKRQTMVGHSLERAHCKENLLPSRKQVAHKLTPQWLPT